MLPVVNSGMWPVMTEVKMQGEGTSCTECLNLIHCEGWFFSFRVFRDFSWWIFYSHAEKPFSHPSQQQAFRLGLWAPLPTSDKLTTHCANGRPVSFILFGKKQNSPLAAFWDSLLPLTSQEQVLPGLLLAPAWREPAMYCRSLWHITDTIEPYYKCFCHSEECKIFTKIFAAELHA